LKWKGAVRVNVIGNGERQPNTSTRAFHEFERLTCFESINCMKKYILALVGVLNIHDRAGEILVSREARQLTTPKVSRRLARGCPIPRGLPRVAIKSIPPISREARRAKRVSWSHAINCRFQILNKTLPTPAEASTSKNACNSQHSNPFQPVPPG